VKVEFRRSFKKDLSKIRNQDLLMKIKGVIEEVENAESLLDISNIKKLNANRSFYRIRVGDYRIGLTDNDGVITFVRILHRKEIYRYFP
jgi:mRNA interferase RelE/StbE